MSATFFLFLAGWILGLLAFGFHVAMIVQGFKTSVRWGLICLLLFFLGSVVFAFAKFGGGKRRVLAVVYLICFLGFSVLNGVAAYQTAQAAAGAEEAAAEGMQEAEKQIDDLSKVEDIQLDL
ncbi:MAG: hypothetical protein JRF63_04785 [Deltaproteobacteria bacterium]|nr:hypothetical protein [Deltaproteobacteria bacterium]